MGFRPGSKSSGMAARIPWYAAATAAAGEVIEGADPFIIYVASRSFMVWQHRGAGRGYRSGQSGEFTFTMDSLFDRSMFLVE